MARVGLCVHVELLLELSSSSSLLNTDRHVLVYYQAHRGLLGSGPELLAASTISMHGRPAPLILAGVETYIDLEIIARRPAQTGVGIWHSLDSYLSSLLLLLHATPQQYVHALSRVSTQPSSSGAKSLESPQLPARQ